MQIVGWSHALEQGGKLALDQSVGYELSLRSSVGSRSRRVVSVATSCVTLTLARSRRLQRAFPDEARNGLSIEVFWYSIVKSIATKSRRIAKNASVHRLSTMEGQRKTPAGILTMITEERPRGRSRTTNRRYLHRPHIFHLYQLPLVFPRTPLPLFLSPTFLLHQRKIPPNKGRSHQDEIRPRHKEPHRPLFGIRFQLPIHEYRSIHFQKVLLADPLQYQGARSQLRRHHFLQTKVHPLIIIQTFNPKQSLLAPFTAAGTSTTFFTSSTVQTIM